MLHQGKGVQGRKTIRFCVFVARNEKNGRETTKEEIMGEPARVLEFKKKPDNECIGNTEYYGNATCAVTQWPQKPDMPNEFQLLGVWFSHIEQERGCVF